LDGFPSLSRSPRVRSPRGEYTKAVKTREMLQARGEMNSEEFLGRLKREVIGHPALVHPFLDRFGEGDASEEGVRVFAIQYYRHVRVSRLYLAALISNCGHDEKLQLSLAEILFDEYGHLNPEETHPALYRRFLTALGISEEEWEAPPTIAEIQLYISAHRELTRDLDFRLGLGALGPASEWPVPPIYVRLNEGLKKATDLPEEALEIFTSHVTMDVTHARIMMEAIVPYTEDEEGQKKVREGAMRSLDARSVMLDGLYKVVYGEIAPLADAAVRTVGS
jgi:pyrroloquinoline-quinone synthase